MRVEVPLSIAPAPTPMIFPIKTTATSVARAGHGLPQDLKKNRNEGCDAQNKRKILEKIM